MDPFSLGVVTGVLANALTPILGQISNSVLRATGLNEVLPLQVAKLVRIKGSLANVLPDAVHRAAHDEEIRSFPLNEEQAKFLQRPEVSELISQIYASNLEASGRDRFFFKLEREFESLIRLCDICPEDRVGALCKPLFNLLWESCSKALDGAIANGLLAAPDTSAASRHKIVQDHIANIEKVHDVLLRTKSESLHRFLDFERRYRGQVSDRYRLLAPPQYDGNKRWPIAELFVQRSFSSQSPPNTAIFSGEDLISLFHRFVVLGQPGGGKSTYLQKLCFDLASGSSGFRTPIVVILREYGAQKKRKDPSSILEFIEERCRSMYQLPPPAGAFEYLLTMGRAIVLFDGLDELLDTSYRRDVTGDLESFCNLYPSVPVVVTSRERGYEQAPLAEDRFATFRLRPLSPEQIFGYAGRLLCLADDIPITDAGLQKIEQRNRVSEFVREAEPAHDLLGNPLMLGLIVNLYHGHNSIPRNRPEVIQKCADMLFVQWDRRRHVTDRDDIPLSEPLLYPAVAHLAHWIYSDPRNQVGVTAARLTDTMTPYVRSKINPDDDAARDKARQFIEFCTGRLWVFTDTGTTATGERLFEFTHRTFLEYFTAIWLVRQHPDHKKLLKRLAPKIAHEEWDVVCQISLQIMIKQQEEAGDDLITDLMNEFEQRSERERLNILSFTARSLQYLVVSPRARRQVAEKVIDTLTTAAMQIFKDLHKGRTLTAFNDARATSVPAAALESLLQADRDNLAVIFSWIRQAALKTIRDGVITAAAAAIEIVHIVGCRYATQMDSFGEASEEWLRVAMSESAQQMRDAASRYFEIAWIGTVRGFVPLRETVANHGMRKLCERFYYTTFPTLTSDSILEMIFSGIFDSNTAGHVSETAMRFMDELGPIFLEDRPPWFAVPADLGYRMKQRNDRPHTATISATSLSADAIFCGFVVAACWLEDLTRHGRQAELFSEPNWLTLMFKMTFQARTGVISEADVSDEMRQSGFSIDQRTTALRWAARELNFTQATLETAPN